METDVKFNVSILGDTYSVEYGSKEKIGINEMFSGECRVFEKKILISTDKEECNSFEIVERVKEVTAHEVLHAYFNSSGLELSSVSPDNVEEVMCSFYQKHYDKVHSTVMECLRKVGVLQ